jgi:hypothetical protein
MNMPGFTAEASLYKISIDYNLTPAFGLVRGVMPQQTPHLFCRPTDCPCQKSACIRGGGIPVPSRQPPCFFTCERR